MSGQGSYLSAQEIEALTDGGMGQDIETMNRKVGRRLQHRQEQWTTLPTTSSTTPIRIMLIGEGGAGKSALGNLLLGECGFVATETSVSDTQKHEEVAGTYGVNKGKITVIDTPGYSFMETTYHDTIDRVIDKMNEAIDVFILVINISHIRSGDLGIKKLYAKQVINQKSIKRFMVVATHSQAHYPSSGVEDFLKNVKDNSDVNKFMTAIKDRVVQVEMGMGSFTDGAALDERAACEKELEQARDMVMAMVLKVIEEEKKPSRIPWFM